MKELKRKPVIGYKSKIDILEICNAGISNGCSVGMQKRDSQGNKCKCGQALHPFSKR